MIQKICSGIEVHEEGGKICSGLSVAPFASAHGNVAVRFRLVRPGKRKFELKYNGGRLGDAVHIAVTSAKPMPERCTLECMSDKVVRPGQQVTFKIVIRNRPTDLF